MKRVILILAVMFSIGAMLSAKEKPTAEERKDVVGYWFMYDLGKKKSGIAYVYEYEGKIYGRTLVTYHKKKDGEMFIETYDKPVSRSPFLEGNPFTTGLDVIWDLQWDPKKEKYVKGYILDPRKKKPYYVDLWREGDVLKVFGNIGAGIGATVYWQRASHTDLPAGVPLPKNLVPKIYPEAKK